MIKVRTLKNSYLHLKQNFKHSITEEEALNRFMIQLIEEAEKDFENGDYYTHEEVWKLVRKMEMEEDNEPISCSI